jgi:hypothetical protein
MKHVFKMAAVAALAIMMGCSYPENNADGGNSSPSGSGDGISSSGGGGGGYGGTSSSGGGDGGGSGINPDITIKNNTGYSFWSLTGGLYIKPSTEAKNWGNSFVRGSTDWNDGESRNFTLSVPLSTNSVYDILLNAGGYNFIKYGVTVSNRMTITFTTGDVNDGSSLPSITLQNRSGKTFNSVHIKPSAISDWGESFGSVGNDGNISATILIPPSNYTVFDIQARSTNPTNTYTRNNVTISNGLTLLFTSADAANPTIEPPVIVIQNNTGYSFWRLTGGLYIKPSTEAENWGSNFLVGYADWYDGESRGISIPQSLSNTIDIKMTAGGYNFIKYNVTVSEGMIVTFTTGDLEQ